jgi:glycosyltransferase involved in cell wall biosynthesis
MLGTATFYPPSVQPAQRGSAFSSVRHVRVRTDRTTKTECKVIGIIIPAHNEGCCIGECVSAAMLAGRHTELSGEDVQVTVVLDTCMDDTGQIAASLGAQIIEVVGRNIGMARATGARAALESGARWLAFTDADSVVPANWLVQQLRCSADAVRRNQRSRLVRALRRGEGRLSQDILRRRRPPSYSWCESRCLRDRIP